MVIWLLVPSVWRAVAFWSPIRAGQLLDWFLSHPVVVLVLTIYAVLLLVWSCLLWLRPVWLVSIGEALRGYALRLPGFVGGQEVSLRNLTLVCLFAYRPRVLDAWVEKRAQCARERFAARQTVADRELHVPLPLRFDGEWLDRLTPASLRPLFAQQVVRVLIRGEGGIGKTSLAFQICSWAMAAEEVSRPCRHKMLPVIIEHDLDNTGEGREVFLSVVAAYLKDLAGDAETPARELVLQLLKQKRIVVVVDGLSELNAATRRAVDPLAGAMPANALIVTSRHEEELGYCANLEPLRLDANRIAAFMDAYLTGIRRRKMFEDPQFFDVCRRLSLMVGGAHVPPLFAKLYADQVIFAQESAAQTDLPANIPELVLHYVNYVNRDDAHHVARADRREARTDNRTVQHAARIVAWECIKHSWQPAPARLDDVMAALVGALGDEAAARDLLQHIEERLRIVETVPPSFESVKFVLDPVAEYLAAIHVVDQLQYSAQEWRSFLHSGDTIPGAPQSVRGFLTAIRECCQTKTNLPEFVAIEVAKRLGLDEQALANLRVEQRILHILLPQLRSSAATDRERAADALCELGPAAKKFAPEIEQAFRVETNERVSAALVRTLSSIAREGSIPVITGALSSSSRGVVLAATQALMEFRRAAAIAVDSLVLILKNEASDDTLKNRVLNTLAVIGPAAGRAAPEFAAALQNPELALAAAIAIVDSGAPVPEVLPFVCHALQTGETEVRDLAARLLEKLGPAAAPVAAELVEMLPELDADLFPRICNTLVKIGPELCVPLLCTAMNDRHRCASAARVVIEFGCDTAMPHLHAMKELGPYFARVAGIMMELCGNAESGETVPTAKAHAAAKQN